MSAVKDTDFAAIQRLCAKRGLNVTALYFAGVEKLVAEVEGLPEPLAVARMHPNRVGDEVAEIAWAIAFHARGKIFAERRLPIK